ncbi:MAG TPA: hypothetical protein VJ826_04260, partial [Candidatus Polarisedimenticolaceae bacterium]|nr:hypothetical protein [Candidatus Polarisedimenticolaceae bacterium]
MPRAVVVGLVVALAVTAVRAQVVRPILLFPTEYASSVAVDQAGNVVYATTSTNQFGSNPAYRKQIVRWDAVTGIGTPVTNYEEGVESVSVSNDASWIAFVSAADPLGTNPDENPELYVMRPDGTGLVQLTSVGLYEEIRAAVISGSGARIAFIGNINPLGTNPTYANALFVIDRNGSNLRQLATGVRVGDPYGNMPGTVDQALPQLGISDDGSKVAYTKSSPSQFAGINADGTGDHALSSGSTPAGIVISGNGATVVTTTGSPLAYSITTRSFDGNPGTIVSIGAGDLPWITDDASTVYYYRSGTLAGIWKIAAGGGTPTLVKTGFRPLGVSGNGGRLVTYGTLELVAIDGTGGSLRQLTTTAHREYVDLKRMASDGNDAQ